MDSCAFNPSDIEKPLGHTPGDVQQLNWFLLSICIF